MYSSFSGIIKGRITGSANTNANGVFEEDMFLLYKDDG